MQVLAAPSSNALCRVNAFDADIGDNGRLTYSLTKNVSSFLPYILVDSYKTKCIHFQTAQFTINETSGEIFAPNSDRWMKGTSELEVGSHN